MSDYLVQIKIKNGPFMRALKRAGFSSVYHLSKKCGVDAGTIGRYANLRMRPLDRYGEFKKAVIKISEVLNTMPSNLFPRQHLELPLPKNTAEFEATADELLRIDTIKNPLHLLEKNKVTDILQDEMKKRLNPIDHEVINHYFGLNGEVPKTLKEIGHIYGVQQERIRQRTGKALRKMRHEPSTDLRESMDVFKDPDFN